MSTPAGGFSATALPRSRTIVLIVYNILLAILFSWGLYRVVVGTDAKERQWKTEQEDAAKTKPPKALPQTGEPAGATPAPAAPLSPDSTANVDSMALPPGLAGADSAETPDTGELNPAPPQPGEEGFPGMIAYVLSAIILAGALGGVLSNLRGVFEFTRENSGAFPAYLEIPFYLRPVSGLLCGLITFFLTTFFAGALTTKVAAGWRTLDGMLPFVGIAFLAGFTAQEFMERLRDTARTLFGSPPAAEPVIPQQNPDPAGGNTESLKPDKGGRESLGGERGAQPPPAQINIVVPQKRAD